MTQTQTAREATLNTDPMRPYQIKGSSFAAWGQAELMVNELRIAFKTLR
jgi:hypothetical protein